MKVDPGSADPPTSWKDKPGELTPDQVTGVISQLQQKINRSVAQILELFDWYFSGRMLSIIGHFDHQVESVAQGGEGQRWQQALLDLTY